MEVSAVYVDLEYYGFPLRARVRYQLASNYLSLFISDWLKERRLDLGAFNRFVFVEGSRVDMQIVGDRAFAVGTSETVNAAGASLISERCLHFDVDVHSYFVGKYLEGFKRVDEYFGLSLSAPLAEAIAVNVSPGLAYETPAGGHELRAGRLRLFHRYTTERYQLVAAESGPQKGDSESEFILMELIPDPFKVHYHVSTITVDGRRVTIANKTGSEVVVKEL